MDKLIHSTSIEFSSNQCSFDTKPNHKKLNQFYRSNKFNPAYQYQRERHVFSMILIHLATTLLRRIPPDYQLIRMCWQVLELNSMLVECINLSIDCYFVIFAGYYSNILSNYVSESNHFFQERRPIYNKHMLSDRNIRCVIVVIVKL